MEERKILKPLAIIVYCGLMAACVIPISGNNKNEKAVIPLAPTGASAAAQSLTSIAVSWNPVSDAVSYKLYRALNDSDPYRPLVSVDSASYTDSGVDPSTEYYYRVAAVSGGIEGQKSNHAFAATKVPVTPVGIKAMVQAVNNIIISWDVVPGAESYKIYRSESDTGSFSALSETGIAATTYSDTTTVLDTDYYYKVSAVNGIGEGPLSEYVYGGTKTPSAPTGLKFINQTATSYTISWNPVVGTTGYKIYHGNTILTSTTEEMFTESGLPEYTYRNYKVSAQNIIGDGAFSLPLKTDWPIPLTINEWDYGSGYCYSFPVTSGRYYIQWNDRKNGDGRPTYDLRVSAYFNTDNKANNLSNCLFSDEDSGYSPRKIINLVSNGFVILLVNEVDNDGEYEGEWIYWAIRYSK
jgi:hypothetical protein